MATADKIGETNPFSTRFVRPGAIEYRFDDEGVRLETLVTRLQENNWRGQIVGPHGSGKTTLIHALRQAVQRPTKLVTVRKGERRRDRLEALKGGEGALLIVDGFEQLSWWTRRLLPLRCQLANVGLLAVTHRSVGLPTLHRTRVTRRLAEQVVEFLLRSQDDLRITPSDIEQALLANENNLRETLFTLYDQVESMSLAKRSFSQQAANVVLRRS